MEVIVVTGGAGFIGSHVVGELLKAGHRVLCVDNFSDNYDPRFKEENIREFPGRAPKYTAGSILQYQTHESVSLPCARLRFSSIRV